MAPLLRVTMWCRDGQSTQTFYSQQSFTTNCKFLRVIIFADRDHQRCNRCTGAGLKGTSLSSEQIQISQRRGEKVLLRCDRISFRLKTKIKAQRQPVLKLFISRAECCEQVDQLPASSPEYLLRLEQQQQTMALSSVVRPVIVHFSHLTADQAIK